VVPHGASAPLDGGAKGATPLQPAKRGAYGATATDVCFSTPPYGDAMEFGVSRLCSTKRYCLRHLLCHSAGFGIS